MEDFGEGGAIGELGFCFYAMFVAIFSYAGVREPFVGEDPAAGVVADAENFAPGAERAPGSVVEGVALKAAAGDAAKAERGQLRFKMRRISDAKLDLCFDSAHCG